MEPRIVGTTMPILELTLTEGERIVAEGGDVSWLSPGFHMDTSTAHGSGGQGGFLSGLKRVLGGGQLFLTAYTAPAGGGSIAFAAQLPGTIRELQIDRSDNFMLQAGSFMASTGDVEISVGLQKKLGAGIFGGEGFLLQKLGGTCDAWVELDGEVRVLDLQPGELLRVNPGHVGMFQAQMAFDVQMMPGIKNKLFGGEGLFLATLTGPGRVWLQTLPIANLAHALEPYLPQPSGDDDSSGVKIVGNLLGGN